jgi:hypothetical protein
MEHEQQINKITNTRFENTNFLWFFFPRRMEVHNDIVNTIVQNLFFSQERNTKMTLTSWSVFLFLPEATKKIMTSDVLKEYFFQNRDQNHIDKWEVKGIFFH